MAQPPRASWTIGERPLSRADRSALELRASGTVLLFYILAVAWMLLCGALAAGLVFVLLGAARFGLGVVVGRLLAAPWAIFTILAKRMWLPNAPTYRIPLKPEEAPRLYAMLSNLAERLKVTVPSRVFVEMHGSAWVQMHGVMRGSGGNTLGVGFDLLAALSASEVRAVLAHELAHARLVHRGQSKWLNKGMSRLSNVANDLSAFAEAKRRANEQSDLADSSEKLFRPLVVRAARLIATYSRQDEFEADHLAAEVVGVAAMRAALAKLDRLDGVVERLPWNERLARARTGEEFTKWIVSELEAASEGGEDELIKHSMDAFATHPTMRDRLGALSRATESESLASDATKGVTLLADPDGIARRLMAEIQRVAAEQELVDTKWLAKKTKAAMGPTKTSTGKALGVIAIVFGVIIALVGLDGFTYDIFFWSVGSIALGVLLLRFAAPGSRMVLPIPEYGTLSNKKRWETRDALSAEEKSITDELRAKVKDFSSGKQVRDLLAIGVKALEQPDNRDYLRVHVAARLALVVSKRSVDANLLYAIAASALGIKDQMDNALEVVREEVGFKSYNVKWAVAWAMCLQDLVMAEDLLRQLHHERPQVATFAALLGYARMTRGKVHSAIRVTEEAARLAAQSQAIAELLAHMLLAAGRVREAGERVKPYEGAANNDSSLAYLFVRIALMEGNLDRAREWATVIRGFTDQKDGLLAVASAFGVARLDDIAGEFFAAALEAGFGPEANIGLATVARFQGDKARSRKHLLAALRVDGAMFSREGSPASVFQQVLGGIQSLEARRTTCRAFIASIPPGQLALSGSSLMVFAPSMDDARAFLLEIAAATQPDDKPFDAKIVKWREAKEEDQPIRPVQPGVKGFVG